MSWLTQERNPLQSQQLGQIMQQSRQRNEVNRQRREKQQKEEKLKNFMGMVAAGDDFETAAQKTGINPNEGMQVYGNYLKFQEMQQQNAKNKEVQELVGVLNKIDKTTPEGRAHGSQLVGQINALQGKVEDPTTKYQQGQLFDAEMNKAKKEKYTIPIEGGFRTEFMTPEEYAAKEDAGLVVAGTMKGDLAQKPKDEWDKALVASQITKNTTANSGGQYAPTNLEKLIAARDAHPVGSSAYKIFDQKIKKDISTTGQRVSVDKDGNITFETNYPADQLDRGAKSSMQKDLMESNEEYRRLLESNNLFKPKFLELGTRWGAGLSDMKDKLGIALNPQEKQNLQEFSTFKRQSMENINAYIKRVTGAQMSEAEAHRLMKAMPNPGSSLFDGDGPTVFKSKLDNVSKELRKSIARLNYVKKHGLKSFEEIPLGQVGGMIEKRGSELENEFKTQNPEISIEDLEAAVKNKLKDEFGVNF